MESSLSERSQLFKETPSLSVVVNNYNYAAYLPEALDSALSQLGPEDEVVVVDDGSTDESASVLARYRGRAGLRIIEQSNQGQLAAVLNGLEASRGELCLLLDSDDWFLPDYLARLRCLGKANPDVDLFFSAPQAGGSSIKAAAKMQSLMSAMALPEGETGVTRWGAWASGEFVGTPTSGLAMRRGLVKRFLNVRDRLPDWVPEDQRPSTRLIPADSHTAFRLSADGLIVCGSSIAGVRKYYCPEPAFYYRVHGSNAYATLGRLSRVYLRLYRARQVARIASAAFELRAPPCLAEVLAEVRQRSRPLRWRRRLRLALNYQVAVLRSRGHWFDRAVAQGTVLRHFLLPMQRSAQTTGGTYQ
ncbi:MAG: glycosyltransferase family 2 protein [Chromatocurvus sp.]